MNADQLTEHVHEALWAEMAEVDASTSHLGEQIRSLLGAIAPLASQATVERVVDEVGARVTGLGPLHSFGLDPAVTEIMVNGDGWVWLERAGRVERSDKQLDTSTTMHLVRRLAANAGRSIDLRSPSVDVRLADGSRLHAIIPPLAVDGPCVTIRRFADRSIDLPELACPAAADILRTAIDDACTIVVAGGTSSGKTTLLNALAAGFDSDARIVTIEDAAELRLPGRHVVRLETRSATETTAAVTLRELVRHALRMRPDRIICGEMRGAEALDLIQAMNTGHDGSLSTVHANSPAGALRRIETMMLLGDAELPLRAIRDQIGSCVDLIVMMRRSSEGARTVASISSVCQDASNGWAPRCLFDGDEVPR